MTRQQLHIEYLVAGSKAKFLPCSMWIVDTSIADSNFDIEPILDPSKTGC